MADVTCKYIELGHAPLKIIEHFGKNFKEDFAKTLENLLNRKCRPCIYKFQNPLNCVPWQIQLLTNDNTENLRNALSCLDNFVWMSRLDSRAAAIEMLMFGEALCTGDVGVQTDFEHPQKHIADELNCIAPKDDLQNDNGNVLNGSNQIMFLLERNNEMQVDTKKIGKAIDFNDNIRNLPNSFQTLHRDGDSLIHHTDYCDNYSRHFKSDVNEQSHVKIVSEEKGLQCSFCEKQFKSNSTLLTHERKHACNKPFMCETCGRSFTHRTDLNNHSKTHFEKKHKCEECGLTFTLLRGLRDHQRLHTGQRDYVCDVCGSSFTRTCNLRDHMLTHTGLKPYKCRYCSKTFGKSCSRVKHERIHTGTRPFVCLICSKGFTQKYNLKVHMRTHEKEKKVITAAQATVSSSMPGVPQ